MPSNNGASLLAGPGSVGGTAASQTFAPGAAGGLLPACPLCVPAGETVLWQGASMRLVRVLSEPGLPAYFRLIWGRHQAEMSDLAPGERRMLWEALALVEQGVRRFFQPDKINLASLGNQVRHLHWHVIGRWADDPLFPGSPWSPACRDAGSAAMQAIAARVEAAIPDFRRWLADQLPTAMQR